MRPLPVANPPNPWAKTEIEYLDEPPEAELSIFEERAKSILAKNDSPDLGFTYSLNPYRGCVHACAYCYARPSHQYWGFGAGTDFDRKIVVKVNAPELLRETFEKRSWQGELVMFSGNTDCYQPLEASYELTRRCLEVCLDVRNPVWVITKGAVLRRDLDLFGELARTSRVGVSLSIPFADASMARAIEPYAGAPATRFETMRRIADRGVRTCINVAPVIPGLNDADIPELLERAKEAGASMASMIPVRLAAEVLPVFRERLAAAYPDRVKRVENALLEMRGGKLNESAFGARMKGLGPRWEMTERLFRSHAARLGLQPREENEPAPPTTFRRRGAQGKLFDI